MTDLQLETGSKRPAIGVIAVVLDHWGSYWQPRHHVLSRLAGRFPVVWVEPSREWRKIHKRPGVRHPLAPPPGLSIQQARAWLPHFHRPDWLGRLTLALRLRRARRRLLRLGCERIVLYIWRPELADALELVDHDFSCYHIDDEYAFSDEEVPTPPEELRLIHAVDHVIVHSKSLFIKKGGVNPHTTLVPNGVAFEAFSRPTAEPADLAAIRRPRVGYAGYIKRQLDWALLRTLAARHPEWSFVFVGPTAPHPDIRGDLDALAQRPNVHFLGAKDVSTLAAYPQHFDVCIMPYRRTADAQYIFPLKLPEYLASGRPTIGPPIPTLLDFADVVALATTPDEWSAAIRSALTPPATSPASIQHRRNIARRYDWDTLVDRIATILRSEPAAMSVAAAGTEEPAAAVAEDAPAADTRLRPTASPTQDSERDEMDRSLASSLAWTTGGKWLAQLLAWVSTVVVARLLSPEDYGLIGMAAVYMGLISLLSEFGVGTTIIALRTLSQRQIAQLNSFALFVGVLSMGISWAAARPLAMLFETPDLTAVIVVMSLGFFVTGFRVVPQALLQKELRFRALAYLDVAQTLALAVVMVTLAALGFRYWTLVIGALASSVFSTIAVVILRPTNFGVPQRRELAAAMTFSWQVIAARFGWYVQVHSDFFVAGKFLGQQALGFYNLAWSLATVPVEKITAMVMRVAPAFLAAVQTRLSELRRYVLGLTEVLALATFPAAFGLALVAPDFVVVVFGDKWHGAAAPLQFLALHAAFQSVAPLMAQVLTVAGETRFAMWASLGAAAVLPAGFYAGSQWGPAGIAAVWVLVYPIVYFPIYRRTLSRIELPLHDYLAVLRPAVQGSAAMVLVVYLCQVLAAQAAPIPRLLLQVLVGVLAYAGIIFGPHRRRTLTLLRMVRTGVRTQEPAHGRGVAEVPS